MRHPITRSFALSCYLLASCIFALPAAKCQEPLYDATFFINSGMTGNYFYSKATWQSPSWIRNIQYKLPVSQSVFFTPGNSLQLQYVNGENGKWEAVIYRQRLRGQDHVREGKWLSFKLFIASDHSKASELPVIQLGNTDSIVSDPLPVLHYLPAPVAAKWHTIIIPLEDFKNLAGKGSTDIQSIHFTQSSNDKKQHEIFIDDIELVASKQANKINSLPNMKKATGYARHIDIKWDPVSEPSVKWIKIYRSVDGRNFSPLTVQIPSMGRYADYTGETGKKYYYKASFLNYNHEESKSSGNVSATTRLMNDDELLTMIQEACFRYYWEGAEITSGLARENIPGRKNMIATGASGFGIMALLVGTERRFITRQQAIDRFHKVLNFLQKAETFHGAYPHFIDGPTAKTEPFFGARDNGGDLVETSFLMQGLLAARAYFNGGNEKEKIIRDKITNIWEKTEWDWYKQFPDSKYLYWHWSPDQGWVINHKLIGWNETMVTYLLAIASPTHPVSASMYYTGWASQETEAQQYRKSWGQTPDGSLYSNGNTYFGLPLKVGVSNGGPLFFTHYSYLGYDPHKINDKYTNYYDNNRQIALINYRYCMENPKGWAGYSDSCWGLTASDGPYHYSANEPVSWQDEGKIAPTGAISSFPYTPLESMNALKKYYYEFGSFLWGAYGFRDAFNLSQNWCSEIYMGLNQAPMVVMIENYRTGLLWRLFMSDRDIQNGIRKIK